GRYGEWVLLKPKSKHKALWIAPIGMLLIGFVVVGFRISQRSKIAPQPQQEPDTEQEVSSYREELLQALEE
ncbi:MAG: cytochrome c-type biogenesis protein CcmH, partial [Myxococcota bacterium]|nr:cytochrome c-type biogenesis protein CcmH [Myxococcota bacterium]